MILKTEGEGELRPLYEFFWTIKALPSKMTTAWRVLVDKLPTRVNLEKKGTDLDSNVCVICGEEEETCNHVFFKCKVAWRVWCMCNM